MARSIDHLVLAVRDLDGAGRLYERLGFQVGARNRHPWGTENRLVQLPGAFLELITVGEGADPPPHGPRRFSFGAFVRDALSRREGLAMLALGSPDAAADARLFAGAGIGDFEPFFFERKGRRPDGSEIRLAFTLAFAADPAARGAGFFVSQHHYPENFWNPEFQQHPNGAHALASVVLASPEPERHRAFLTTLTSTAPALACRSGSGADASTWRPPRRPARRSGRWTPTRRRRASRPLRSGWRTPPGTPGGSTRPGSRTGRSGRGSSSRRAPPPGSRSASSPPEGLCPGRHSG
jgi:catechol 2,3-dioxygenase-like lactoylglutathione lyase family enzyme